MITILLVIIIVLLLWMPTTPPPPEYLARQQLETWRAKDERLARKEAFWGAVANAYKKIHL